MSPVLLLLLASLAVLVGPACGVLGSRSRAATELIDGFSLVVIAGICLLVVVPHVVDELGLAGIAVAAVGVVLPMIGHRLGRDPRVSQFLVVLAVVAHLMLDGAVLSIQGESAMLAWAVVVHRLPVGFAVAVAAQRATRPVWVGLGVSLAMVAATVMGFMMGPPLVAQLPHWGTAGLEALVAGVLLHVAFSSHSHADAHDHEHGDACASHGGHAHSAHSHGDHSHGDHAHLAHGHAHPEHSHSASDGAEHYDAHGAVEGQGWAAAGVLFGILAMLSAPLLSEGVVDGNVSTFLRTLGVLVVESAPALLLGYALAGIVPFLLTASRASALGRGSKLMQSLRGVAFGLPLPVCSCGVLPLYESLIRRGAPPVAAVAFFVATPELGLDAVLLSVPLLGASLTVARVVTAFLVAVLVALLVGWRMQTPAQAPAALSEAVEEEPWGTRIRSGLRFGFVEVFDHTMPWIALGLIIAAVAEPMLSHGAIDAVPRALQVPLAALVGVPMYVCASGATPVAALAIHKGLSTGAAMAFLIAGPATNVTTFGVLSRLHGRRMAFMFGVTVTALSILAGWTVDLLGVPAAPVLEAHTVADTHGSWLAWVAVVGLMLLVVASLVRQGPRGALRQIFEPIHVH